MLLSCPMRLYRLKVSDSVQLFASFFLLISTIHLVYYQGFLSDDAGWPRGYRAGSKLFSLAAIMDALSQALQLSGFLFMYSHFDINNWVIAKHGGAEWLVFTLARIFHGMAFGLYAKAIPLLEVYHDVGTSEFMATCIFTLFHLSAALEILTVVLPIPAQISFAVTFVAIGFALSWSLAFEPQTNYSSPLHETELVNTIESEVNQFAHMTPYHNN
eukprot:GHVH01011705.1.p1 GENE.GHVH01011705.1~~GHVH01011705.1.p1  ORF type:complete len:215 (+),score=20.71 GHVH01011705.1:447-1091(+)